MDYAMHEQEIVVWNMVQAYEDWITKQQASLEPETFAFIDFEEDKSDLYKLDFTRPKIQDQVLERKPKHLIKKVIR